MKTFSSEIEIKEINNDSEQSHVEGNGFIVTLLVAVAALALAILFVYFSNFNGNYGTQEVFGAFGDFIGGTLNPVFGFATIVLLIWSIRLQRKELVETRIEFKRSAEAQEKIEKNQRDELNFYKNKETIEHIKSELKILDLKKQEILNSPFMNNTDISLNAVVNIGTVSALRNFQHIMLGYNYTGSQEANHLPITNIITRFISYIMEYYYYLQKLQEGKEHELYLMKVHSFISFIEKLAALRLGTKIQLNGIATKIDKSITALPDLEDETLNGLKTFILERVIQIHILTENIEY